MKKISVALCLLLLLAGLAVAQQNTLTQTTLSAAITANDTVLTVASATGISVPSAGVAGTALYIIDPGAKQGELVTVTAAGPISTAFSVRRGRSGTKSTAHISGALVMIGAPNLFQSADPAGGCTASSVYVTPWVNVNTGNQWICSSVVSAWVPGFSSDMAPAVSAAVASAAGLVTPSGPLFHITGALAITGFNIPIGFTGGPICVIPDAAFTTTTANNIALASTGVISKLLCFAYDSATAKFYPSY